MPAASYVASPTIRHAVIGGLRVLLDLEREVYRVLDDSASIAWAVLIGEVARDEAAELFDFGKAGLDVELAAFARRCLDEGILRDADASPAVMPDEARAVSRLVGSPSVRAWLSLIFTRRSLARTGFRRTYISYAHLSADRPPLPLGRELAAFTRAENGFLSRRAPDDCLVRSLALFRFLRDAGLPVRHVIGVQRFPFAAHAWVEHCESPLLGERPLGFRPLATIGQMAME